MNTRQKILLDNIVAKPFAFLFNFVVRIAGKIFRIDHNLDIEFRTIAICKFKGMGSIIQSIPMVNNIRIRYPNAEIIYVSSASNKGILKKFDCIDNIITVDDSSLVKFIGSNIKALFLLIKKHPQIYFDLEIYSDYSTLFTTFTCSQNRVGFYLRSSSFRMGIYTHMMFFNPRISISNVYLQLAQLIDCDINDAKLIQLKKNPESKTIYKNNYIVINPNASDLRLERRWDKEKFVNLVSRILLELPNYEILLIGNKEEQEYTQEIESKIDSTSVVNTAGETSLDELIQIVNNAKIMISNDTGPMHIAFCTNTPIICLFGPCSPEQYGINENAHIIYKPLYCSPCVHDFQVPPCGGNNECMKLITVAEVFDKLVEVLNGKTSVKNSSVTNHIYKVNGITLGTVNR